MSYGLHRIGVERYLPLPAYGADLRNGHNGTDLIVGVHDRHKTRIFPNRFCNLFRIYHAVLMNIQKFCLVALFFQILQRMQYGMMLEGRRNDMLLT